MMAELEDKFAGVAVLSATAFPVVSGDAVSVFCSWSFVSVDLLINPSFVNGTSALLLHLEYQQCLIVVCWFRAD